MREVQALAANSSLCAVVYTELADVEIEVNGLVTYDRRVLKVDRATLAEAHTRLIAVASLPGVATSGGVSCLGCRGVCEGWWGIGCHLDRWSLLGAAIAHVSGK